ncbi:NTD biosynthesis operon protein NtdA [Mycobacteroides immunogenum]|uniref:NTD biosynthesis operon protein NtdA n=1 Tax=Mycobacteroides immunogenum TaxID=83262 RepID=A0A179V8V8_9MYCO|nr:aminotransferase class I/II-fold pyridoxal phosphate-dependent enzyme [Mycobacteroides immunogenum]OAT66746.1 NTD biosynthesis operon protein NtdA [Mycobacteroides immunogenum]
MSIAESINVPVPVGSAPSSKTRELARALLSGREVHPDEIPPGRAYTTLRDLATHPGLRGVSDVLAPGTAPDTVDFLPLARLVNPAELPAIRAAVDSVLPTGKFTSGPHVDAFEDEIASYLGIDHVIGASSGTDALTAVLLALGAGPGTEVILPANSFAATENAVFVTGARPVLVDTRAEDYLLDPAEVEAAITSRTVAVLPVHLYGAFADVRALTEVASRHGIPVVEDACQGIGLDGLGHHSDAAILSFNPYKNLGAVGKAGAVATRLPGLAQRVTELLYHGFAAGQKNVKAGVYGLNSRLDNLQAAVLRARLDWLGQNNLARSILARRYVDGLADLAATARLRLPTWDADHVWHLFTVEVIHDDRDAVTAALRDAGIATDLYYPVLTHKHQVPSVADLFEGVRLPRTEASHARIFQLPLYPGLTLAEQDRVIGALHDVLA